MWLSTAQTPSTPSLPPPPLPLAPKQATTGSTPQVTLFNPLLSLRLPIFLCPPFKPQVPAALPAYAGGSASDLDDGDGVSALHHAAYYDPSASPYERIGAGGGLGGGLRGGRQAPRRPTSGASKSYRCGGGWGGGRWGDLRSW